LFGKKHGKGKYNWSDTSYYEGDWVENRISGYVSMHDYILGNILVE
jgi:hypothetical protein